MTEQQLNMAKTIREKYTPEIESKFHKKVKNVFFLTSGLDGGSYFVVQTNNGILLCILKIENIFEEFESMKII